MRLSTLLGASLAFTLMFASLAYWGYQTYETTRTSPERRGDLIQQVNNEQRIQFLFLHEKDKSLNTVYLFSYDSISGRLSAIYLPVEGKIMSPSYGDVMNLNELYERFSSDQLRKELQSALQLEIPFWIKSDGDDLRRFVDAIGGLNIEFPVRASRDSDSSKTEIRWMDGPQVNDYVNEAYEQFHTQGRRFRHKTFFLGLKKRIQSKTNFFRHPLTIHLAQDLFESNLTESDWETLVQILRTLETNNVKFPSSLHLVKARSDNNTIDPEPLKNMLPKPLKKMIEQAEPQKIIDVQVLNGAGINKLAGAVRDKLQPHARVDVVEVGNADRYNYETTQIIDRSNNPESAAHLRDLLGTGSIQSNPSEKLLVDVTVIVGKDLRHLTSPP